jgi:hypothetical protein
MLRHPGESRDDGFSDSAIKSSHYTNTARGSAGLLISLHPYPTLSVRLDPD